MARILAERPNPSFAPSHWILQVYDLLAEAQPTRPTIEFSLRVGVSFVELGKMLVDEKGSRTSAPRCERGAAPS